MSTSSPDTMAIVIDDTHIHYNITRDAAQATAPSDAVSSSVDIAMQAPWNSTLTVITTPTSFWYNVTGYTRIAVYGPVIPPTSVDYTAWANYTINGNYTAGNVTTLPKVVRDFPLFVSGDLELDEQYNLTVDIAASPDAPYLLDYLVAYSPLSPTPIVVSNSSTTSSSGTGSQAPTQVATPSSQSPLKTFAIPIVAALAGISGVLLALVLILSCCCMCRRRKKPNTIEAPVPPEPPFPPRVPKATTISTSARTSSQHSGSAFSPAGQPFPAQHNHHRSVTMPAPFMVPSTRPAMTTEAQRSVSPTLPRSSSAPRLALPPMTLPMPTPFPAPLIGDVLRPTNPTLPNPYDSRASAAQLTMSAPPVRPMRPAMPEPSSSMASARSAMPTPSLVSTPSVSSTTALIATPTLTSVSTPTPPAAAAVPPAATAPQPATPAVLGPNEYPKEKQEVRLEPPQPQPSLYALSTDLAGPSTGNPFPAESPPAYSS